MDEHEDRPPRTSEQQAQDDLGEDVKSAGATKMENLEKIERSVREQGRREAAAEGDTTGRVDDGADEEDAPG